MPADAAFRDEIAAWLAENCPPEMRDAPAGEDAICWGGRNWRFASDAQRLWLERMAGRGWTAPTWPVEYGGGGLTRPQEKILREEMARIGARSPLESFGLWMLGPALLRFGTEEQKRNHLPPITRGEIRWCQGYSEPGAGSDLANVQTRAEDRGDHCRSTGQKVWTSYADQRRLDLRAGAHRSRGAQAQGHLVPADRHGDARRLDPPDPPDLGHARPSARRSSTTWRCRRRTWSARRARAGTSPSYLLDA